MKRLTRQQEAEVKRRYELNLRCCKWLKENTLTAAGAEMGVSAKTASKVSRGGSCLALTDDQRQDLIRLAKYRNKVSDIQKRNRNSETCRLYGIPEERIHSIAREGGSYRQRKTSTGPVDRFLTMALSKNPTEGLYYGFAG